MADKKITINTDAMIDYVKLLPSDMKIAYGVLVIGIAMVIIGLMV